MTSKVIKGHKRSFVQNLILLKFYMNNKIKKTHFFHNMKFYLKGHIRSHNALLCLKNITCVLLRGCVICYF